VDEPDVRGLSRLRLRVVVPEHEDVAVLVTEELLRHGAVGLEQRLSAGAIPPGHPTSALPVREFMINHQHSTIMTA
jgi:hypothetical protein